MKNEGKCRLLLSISVTKLWHFLLWNCQICYEPLQMLVGRLGLEPRATWLKVM